MLRRAVFVLQQAQDRVGGLDHRHAQIALGNAHHGAAADDPLGLFVQTTGHLNQIVEGGADADDEVLGLGNGLAGNGHDSLGQGDSQPDRPVDGGVGGHVEHRAAHADRQLAGGALPVR